MAPHPDRITLRKRCGARVEAAFAWPNKAPHWGWVVLAVILLVAQVVLPLPAAAQAAPAGYLANPNSDDEVVYIDPSGYIRVYDPVGEPKVTWVSPEGGWSAAAGRLYRGR